MDRREFLKYSAIAAGSLMFGSSCAHLTSRYTRPGGLTKKAEKLLLTNATVIDVNKGTFLRNRQLLIYNGRIAKISHNGRKSGITPDRTINLGGAYVIPGLINAHCHMTLPGGYGTTLKFMSALKRQSERNAEECIKHGVTTVRDMLSPFNWMTDLKNKISKGKIVGPRILSCCALQVNGGYLRQLGYLSPDRYWIDVNNPGQGKRGVREAVDNGADFIKLFQQPIEMYLPGKKIPVMDSGTMEVICNEADKFGKKTALHHVTSRGMEKGVFAGVSSLDHLACDKEINDSLLRNIVDNKTFIVPTMSVAYAMAFERFGDTNWGKGRIPEILEYRKNLMNSHMKEFLEPEIYNQSSKAYKKYSDPNSYEKSHLFYWIDPTIPNAAAVTGEINLKKLYKAGAQFGCGNDGGVPFIFPGDIGLEMFMYEKIGLPKRKILQMATINNARLLGLETEIGSVEEGKVADIAILKKNPFSTMQNLFKPDIVIREGQLMYNSGTIKV